MSTTIATTKTGPHSDIDLFARESLCDPYADYKELRDRGRIVFMTQYGFWAVTRYDEVKKVLADPDTFSARSGNTLNPIVNEAWRETLAVLEGKEHARLSRIFVQQIGPKVVGRYQQKAETEAALLVDALLDRGEIDLVADMAEVLPVNVALDIIGVPREEDNRNQLLGWASETYHCCAPETKVEPEHYKSMDKLYGWAKEYMAREKLSPGSTGVMTWEAVDDGRITDLEAWGVIVGYVTAGLDTTASALGNLMMLFIDHPDQWEVLRSDPSLVRSAVLEGLRMETPAQWFSKVTTKDVEFDDAVVPEGATLVHFYGAANRDERHFPDPDRFDVRRNPVDHLAFGYGEHTCAGRNLSYLEEVALVSELVRRVDRFELAAEPVRHVHNLMRGWESIRVRVSAR